MKIMQPGHKYELENFIDKESKGQEIQFIYKSATDESFIDGTSNEEVIAVLIDRLEYLNNKFPCAENKLAITHLRWALTQLEERTKNRVSRGVEGKHLA